MTRILEVILTEVLVRLHVKGLRIHVHDQVDSIIVELTTCVGGKKLMTFRKHHITYKRILKLAYDCMRLVVGYGRTETDSFPSKKVKSVYFPMYFRIPEWCKDAKVLVNGETAYEAPQAGETVRISRRWAKGDVVTLEFPMEVSISHWYDGATVVERGPLVYALKMEEKWEKHEFEASYEGKYGPYYYTCISDTPWNYGFRLQDMTPELMMENFKVEVRENTGSYPWNVDNAPVSIRAKAFVIKPWKEYNGSTGQIAYYREDGDDTGEEVWIELIPYGCTTLRVTEFPTRL